MLLVLQGDLEQAFKPDLKVSDVFQQSQPQQVVELVLESGIDMALQYIAASIIDMYETELIPIDEILEATIQQTVENILHNFLDGQ